jgi:membrane protease YdiL (CAAX protease family)
MHAAGLALIVLGMALLRLLDPVPGLARLWSHPLGLVLLLLFVVWVGARSDGRRFAALPFLGAVAAEGWLRLAFLNPAFETWLAPRFTGQVTDAVYHLLGAAWLIGVVLVFHGRCGVDLRSPLAAERWRRAIYAHTVSLLMVYGTLGGLLQSVEGFRGVSVKVPIYSAQALWSLAGQAALCLGEEIFYRGFLFGALLRALSSGGVAGARGRVALAAGLAAALFACDHLRGIPADSSMLMTGLYTFGLGLLLTLLVRLTGNLALAALAHLFHNLMLLRLGVAVSDLSGLVWYESMTYISLYFIALFALLFLIRRPAWEPLRRALAGPSA